GEVSGSDVGHGAQCNGWWYGRRWRQDERERQIRRQESRLSGRRNILDTIYALSTAPGRAGVAVIRVSGERAREAVSRLAGVTEPRPREAMLRRLRDPAGGAVLDRGLVLFFDGPGSFTGEDVAEFHIHG